MLDSTQRADSAKTFCDLNAKKVSQIVAFLANAKLGRSRFVKPYTSIVFTLKHGNKSVWAKVPVVDPSPPKRGVREFGDWEEKMLDRLFSAFKLGGAWNLFKSGPVRWSAHSLMLVELCRRGGSCGIDLLRDIVHGSMESRNLHAKRDAHRRQGELNRAMAHLRKARKLGATSRQMNKLARTILAEEAVEQVQGS